MGAFWSRVIIWTNLLKDHKLMLHANYQKSGSYGFRKKRCFKIFLWKADKSQSGTIIGPGHNLNSIGRGPLGDATCQISQVLPYGFREDTFENNVVNPRAGPFCARVHNLIRLGKGLQKEHFCEIWPTFFILLRRRSRSMKESVMSEVLVHIKGNNCIQTLWTMNNNSFSLSTDASLK